MNFELICINATLYNPASSHYDDECVNVQCDMCMEDELTASYGYMEHDLCYKCYRKIYNEKISKISGRKITGFSNYKPKFKVIKTANTTLENSTIDDSKSSNNQRRHTMRSAQFRRK